MSTTQIWTRLSVNYPNMVEAQCQIPKYGAMLYVTPQTRMYSVKIDVDYHIWRKEIINSEQYVGTKN